MKICMIAPLPPPYGGIANWSLLVSQYVDKCEDVEMVTINTAPKKRGVDGRTLWDRTVVEGFAIFKHRRAFINKLKSNKIDAIHITTSGQLAVIRDIALLKAARRKATPAVYHLHFGRVPEIAKKNTREWKLLKKAMLLSNTVIAIDQKTKRAIEKYAPDVKVCYIPNPFDLSKIDDSCHDEKISTSKQIVFVGWVVKTKGIEELLCAWETLEKKHPEWTLRIIGPYDNLYLDEIRSHFLTDNVIFEGEMKHDDAMSAVSASEIFILPSYTEGFPNAVLEAMSLQKSIVATAVGAIPEMLDGCGIVIPPQSPEDIITALDKLMLSTDLRQELGLRARQKLESEYTIDKVFAMYKQLWSDIGSDV